jgi:ribulose-phosphate 3-epimerase
MVLCPATPISQIEHVLDEVDLVLIMTVNPGFGGQAFIESMVPKVEQLAKLIDDRNLSVEIEVNGGFNEKTAQAYVKAGANVLVAGSAIYKADN